VNQLDKMVAGGDLHDDRDLEMERKAELDILKLPRGGWADASDSHVVTDIAEVKPLLDEAFKTGAPPHVLLRFVRWLYGVTTYRLVDVHGHPNFSYATLSIVERVVNEFIGLGGDSE